MKKLDNEKKEKVYLEQVLNILFYTCLALSIVGIVLGLITK